MGESAGTLPALAPTIFRALGCSVIAIGNRTNLIDFLLRREFGSLAPPPSPSLRSTGVETASERNTGIESRRKEYEAMDMAALKKLEKDANTEDEQKAREFFAQCQAVRETYWPHWAKKDLWSETEFAALCCGLVPDERGKPGDPGKSRSGSFQTIAIERANDDIRRGTLSRTLAFVPRNDADTAATLYGTARHYVPAVASEWAASRFDSFPSLLLTAVRERARMTQEPAVNSTSLGGSLNRFPLELRAAIEAFDAVRNDAAALAGRSPRKAIEAWLQQNRPELSANALDRIATIANWQPGGGAPKTPGGITDPT